MRIRLVPTLVVLVLVGCGGEDRLSKREYEQKVRAEYAEVQEAFRATRGAEGAELGGRIEDAQAQLREAADELADEAPPQEVEAENAQLVDAMRRFADSLDRLRNAAIRGEQEVIEDATARIGQNEAVEQMAEAAERMKFKGYDLGPIAEE